jgi:oligoribonuclease
MNTYDAIVWIDTETTGLDYKKEALLEIAVVITDSDLTEIARYESIIKTPKRKLRRMGEYVLNMHTKTGLLAELPSAAKTQKQVEEEILTFLDRWGLMQKLMFGGNSVHFDRRMLETRMPKLMSRFTHQNLDVSSIGIVVKRWAPHVYEFIKAAPNITNENARPHRALSDILDCIESLRQYRMMTFTTESEDYLNASRGA